MTIEETRMRREHVWRGILQDQVSRHWLNLYYPDVAEKPAPVVLELPLLGRLQSGFYRESDTEHETYDHFARPRNCFENSITGPFASSIKILHHTDPTS